MPKSGPARRFPDATAADPHKTHASNENSLEGPCWVCTTDTLKAHILLSNFLWENVLTGQSPKEITNLLGCIYYNYPFFSVWTTSTPLKKHPTLVPIETVSFFQLSQEVGCVGFLSYQSKMRISTIFFLPQDVQLNEQWELRLDTFSHASLINESPSTRRHGLL